MSVAIASGEPDLARGSPFHRSVRWAERWVPSLLFPALAAPETAWAAIRCLRSEPGGVMKLRTLCAKAGASGGWWTFLRDRYRMAAADGVRRWPERLCEPRWQQRCRLVNDDILRRAIATGRPVVLLSLHYGSLWSMHHWMRAVGFPTAALTMPRGEDPVRVALEAVADRAFGCAGVPRRFGIDRNGLRQARAFLARPGGLLAIIIDGGGGEAEQIDVAVDGLRSKVRLGAFRMAESSGAIAIPVLAAAGPRMGCEITFCEPVPDALIADRARHIDAAADALAKLMPIALRHPAQFDARHAPVPA